MNAPIRIVMTLVLRDEADILADNLDYHLSRGIDFVIATDHRSKDATPEILARYEARGLLRWFREEDPRFRQGHWVTHMARLAGEEYGADWIINNDADEFWWPKRGDLKDALASVPGDAGSLAVPRFNFAPAAGDGPFWQVMTVRDDRSENCIGRPLPPKRCHRADAEIVTHTGLHQIFTYNIGRPAGMVPVEIFHFPDRSLEQVTRAVAKHNDSRRERQWAFSPRLHLARLQRGGALRHYWDARQVDLATVAAGRAGPHYRIDTRFRDYMARLSETGLSPS